MTSSNLSRILGMDCGGKRAKDKRQTALIFKAFRGGNRVPELPRQGAESPPALFFTAKGTEKWCCRLTNER